MKKIIAVVLAGAIFAAIAGVTITHSQQKDSVVSGIDLAAQTLSEFDFTDNDHFDAFVSVCFMVDDYEVLSGMTKVSQKGQPLLWQSEAKSWSKKGWSNWLADEADRVLRDTEGEKISVRRIAVRITCDCDDAFYIDVEASMKTNNPELATFMDVRYEEGDSLYLISLDTSRKITSVNGLFETYRHYGERRRKIELLPE